MVTTNAMTLSEKLRWVLRAHRIGATTVAFVFTVGLVDSVGAATITEFAIPTGNSCPQGITAGPDGALWFTERCGNKIGRITTAGTITEFPIPTSASGPVAITAGPDGALWFTEGDGNKIGRITTVGTIMEFAIPTANSRPSGITTGPDGALWFTEFSASKIGRITTAGAISEFALPAGSVWPTDITTGQDGALWFTKAQAGSPSGKIGRISTAGVITEFAISTSPQEAHHPVSITVGPDGALWFTEYRDYTIGRITTAGTVTKFATPWQVSDYGWPQGITTGPDGALWFGEELNGFIGRTTPAGITIDFPVPTGGGQPLAITAGPDGALWFTEGDGNKIGRIITAVLGSTRFVATTGNDSSNTCLASGSPCKTITHVLTQAAGGDTISVAAGTYNLALGETFPLTINMNLTLTGGGAGSTILDATGANTRVITIGDAWVTITGVTITGGHVSCTDRDAVGGGLRNNGTLILTNSTVSGNTASCINNMHFTVGGGLANFETMILTDSTVSGNTASCTSGGDCVTYGGGLANWYGTTTITNSTVSGNTASGISNGYYVVGGGLKNSGTMTLTNSTVSGNTASCTSGGLGCGATGGGLSSYGTLTVTNSTVSGNSVTCSGAGCIALGGGVNNDDSTVTLHNSIVAKQLAGSDCSSTGTLTSKGFNLDSDSTCQLIQPSDHPGVTKPRLGALQDNGGPTQTHALLPGSPAIDAGTNSDCPATDQRGVTRPQGATCDIGAYEFTSSPTTYSLTVTKAGTGSGTVTSNPAGIDCGETCSASYVRDTIVTLAPISAAGSAFFGWSGACNKKGQVTLDADKTCTATFDLAGPDLTGTWKALTQSCKVVGTDTTLQCKLKGSVRVRNQGNQKALGVSFLQFYLSADMVWDGSDTLLHQVAVGTLKPGKAKTKKINYKLPTGQTGSGQYILAVIDATGLIPELDETNNAIVFGPLP